jgi:hypothetical protein
MQKRCNLDGIMVPDGGYAGDNLVASHCPGKWWGEIKMASTTTKVGAWAAIGTALLVHLSGGLRDLEEHITPVLLDTSFNLFHLDTAGLAAAEGALVEASKGSEDDKVAYGAACAVLNSGLQTTPQNQDLVSRINNQISWVPNNPIGNALVETQVKNLASKIQGATEPGAMGQLYRRACL